MLSLSSEVLCMKEIERSQDKKFLATSAIAISECQSQVGKTSRQLFHFSLKYLVSVFLENEENLIDLGKLL